MNLLEQLKREEGEVLYAYQDSLGWLTIGVGICIDKRRGCGLRQEESDFVINNRLQLMQTELAQDYPWFQRLNEPRRAALVQMRHQLGRDGLNAFQKMLGAIRDERWAEAEREAIDSDWAKQTPERARRMARQLETGEWQ